MKTSLIVIFNFIVTVGIFSQSLTANIPLEGAVPILQHCSYAMHYALNQLFNNI